MGAEKLDLSVFEGYESELSNVTIYIIRASDVVDGLTKLILNQSGAFQGLNQELSQSNSYLDYINSMTFNDVITNIDKSKESTAEWLDVATEIGNAFSIGSTLGMAIASIEAISATAGPLGLVIGLAFAAIYAIVEYGDEIFEVFSKQEEPIGVLTRGIEFLTECTDEYGNTTIRYIDEISEGTRQAAEDFLGMSDTVKATFEGMVGDSETANEDILKNVADTTEEYTSTIVQGYEAQRDAKIAYWEDDESLTQEQREAYIAFEEEFYAQKIANVEENEAKINAIVQESLANEGVITEEAWEEINNILFDMQTQGIEALSEHAWESDLIIADMVNYAIDQACKEEEETVAAAERKFKEEFGILSERQLTKERLNKDGYEKAKAQLEEERDTAIAVAAEKREGKVSELNKERDSSDEILNNMLWDATLNKNNLKGELEEGRNSGAFTLSRLFKEWDKYRPDKKHFTSVVTVTGEKGSIKGFATGGLVTRPVNAIVGEGGECEAIIPLSKFPRIMAEIMARNNIGAGDIAPQEQASSAVNAKYAAEYNMLAGAINRLADRPNVISIDGHELMSVTAGNADKVYGNRLAYRERGLALV